MKKLTLISAVLLLFFLLSGCSETTGVIRTVQGNYAFEEGDYQRANLFYFMAKDHVADAGWIEYNLGNVYYFLGETNAAFIEWQNASFSDSTEVQFRVLFNQGVLYYQNNDYQLAYNAFREALMIRPQSAAAKINLEYAFKRLGVQEKSNPSGQEEGSEEARRILEYIKKAEQPDQLEPQNTQRGEVNDW